MTATPRRPTTTEGRQAEHPLRRGGEIVRLLLLRRDRAVLAGRFDDQGLMWVPLPPSSPATLTLSNWSDAEQALGRRGVMAVREAPASASFPVSKTGSGAGIDDVR